MPKLKKDKKIIVGVTGGFGSGKSTVAGILAAHGARVIDADKVAASLLRPASGVYRKVVSVFGAGVIGKAKKIDRAALAKIVFSDKKLLKKLNNLVHPEVIRIIRARMNSQKKGVIVLDAPLLLEAGLKKAVDKLIVVKAGREAQVQRLLRKSPLTKADILRRIKSQIPLRAKARLADFIIDNNGTIAETRKQVKEIVRKLSLVATINRGRLGINFLTRASGKIGRKLWKS